MLAASLLTSQPSAYGEKHAVPSRHGVFTGACSLYTHRMQLKCTRMQFKYTRMQFKYTRISHVLMCAYELRSVAPRDDFAGEGRGLSVLPGCERSITYTTYGVQCV